MKYYIALFWIITTWSVSAQSSSYFPKPTGFINDFERDFSKQEYDALDYAVKDILSKTMVTDGC